jgi:hypothetical protein
MTVLENAVITEYKTSQIRVQAKVNHVRTGKTYVLYLILSVVMFLLFYAMLTPELSPEPRTAIDRIILSLVLGAVFGGMFVFLLSITDVWKKPVSIYSVGLVGVTDTSYDHVINNYPEIEIVKTTPEKDQVEVCKAADQLKSVAQNFDNDLVNIQKIADKCK